MSDKKMYFGNRAYMQWIPCPEAGADYTSEGSSQSAKFLNGGAFHRQTLSAAKRFQLSWSLTTRDNIRTITDYAEGVYGGTAMYWCDPFTMDRNMLAQSFATPSLGGYDGAILTGTDVRPQLVPTSANSLGYPTQSAVYTVATSNPARRHWIPIPPGYKALVGAHGTAGSGGQVRVITTKGLATSGAATPLTLLPVTSSTRFNTTINASPTVDGFEIYLGGSGTITLSGIMVQVVPIGTTASTGGFISGQGHSGCSFEGMPAKNAYSAALDLVGLTATFIETEQWA